MTVGTNLDSLIETTGNRGSMATTGAGVTIEEVAIIGEERVSTKTGDILTVLLVGTARKVSIMLDL